jgi:cystathionine beta-lyase
LPPGYHAAVALLSPPGADGFDELDEQWLRSRPGVKWAAADDGVLPGWVADMDFPAPRPVVEALVRLAEGGDLGYSTGSELSLLEEKWAARMATRYRWDPAPGQLRLLSDTVQAARALIELASSPGDGVLLLTPSYPSFVGALEEMRRRLLPVQAVPGGANWAFDFDAAAAVAHQAKVLLLVNPHNPTGRMLDRAELLALGELAERNDLLVISDEIHADLALSERAHIPFASLSEDLAARTVTLYSASKAYNLGGMCCAVAHVGAPEMARQLTQVQHTMGRVSIAAVASTLASWSPEGDAWLERCVARLRANRELLGQWLGTSAAGGAAGAQGYLPEATYLSWMDFRGAGLGDDPAEWLLLEARVMLSAGPPFGPGGTGFARLNFATAPGILSEMLGRIAEALRRRDAGTQEPPRD